MDIRRFVAGPLENNTYLVSADGVRALVIDPAHGMDELLDRARQSRLSIDAVLLTHGHFDHFLGLPQLLEAFPDAAVYGMPEVLELVRHPERNGSGMVGAALRYDGDLIELAEGETEICGVPLTVFKVPGHSPCGCCFLIGDQLFSGDCLFAGTIGRTDFPYGNTEQLVTNIREKLMALPDDTVVWSGHGGRTTIGRERRLNPFLQS